MRSGAHRCNNMRTSGHVRPCHKRRVADTWQTRSIAASAPTFIANPMLVRTNKLPDTHRSNIRMLCRMFSTDAIRTRLAENIGALTCTLRCNNKCARTLRVCWIIWPVESAVVAFGACDEQHLHRSSHRIADRNWAGPRDWRCDKLQRIAVHLM